MVKQRDSCFVLFISPEVTHSSVQEVIGPALLVFVNAAPIPKNLLLQYYWIHIF